jgi:peptide deformylase
MRSVLLTAPDPRLYERAGQVVQITDAVRSILDDMGSAMAAHFGIGLAAPQIGVPLRMVVMQIAGGPLREMINPEITFRSAQHVLSRESCLSVPGLSADMRRHASVRVAYTDRTGRRVVLKAAGLLATCIQHEVDHLDGKVIGSQP